MTLHADLPSAVAGAVHAARSAGTPTWVAVPVAAGDLAPGDWARVGAGERFSYERPAEGLAVAGLGAAWSFECEGPRRFDAAAREARALGASVHRVASEHTAQPPLLVGGFGFDERSGPSPSWHGFPAARLVLPELALAQRAGEVNAVALHRVEPGANDDTELARARATGRAWRTRLRSPAGGAGPSADGPRFSARAQPHERYRSAVADALAAIAAGDLEKVVLARRVEIERPGGFDVERILASLRRVHPGCASFALQRGDVAFLGASPERLVRLTSGRVETAAVAGSAPRGRNPGEDHRLARELVESKKEQAEHAIVVRALREALEPVCGPIDLPEAPRLMRLDGIQHLETRLRCRARPGTQLLDLVGRLHPTPAVAGAPRAAARRWIAEREGFDRGWYAGAVGFVDAAGDGEFCVALRSALLRGEVAELFAGAGIVAGSEPEAELHETRLKLRAMIGALVEL